LVLCLVSQIKNKRGLQTQEIAASSRIVGLFPATGNWTKDNSFLLAKLNMGLRLFIRRHMTRVAFILAWPPRVSMAGLALWFCAPACVLPLFCCPPAGSSPITQHTFEYLCLIVGSRTESFGSEINFYFILAQNHLPFCRASRLQSSEFSEKVFCVHNWGAI
jgi:hypothetical protein